jgi:hypothetical protein
MGTIIHKSSESGLQPWKYRDMELIDCRGFPNRLGKGI